MVREPRSARSRRRTGGAPEPRIRARRLLALTILALGACAREEPEWQVRRVALVPRGEPVDESVTVLRVNVTEESAATWRHDGDVRVWGDETHPERKILAWEEGTFHELGLAGPFDPRGFTHARVTYMSRASQRVQICLRKEGWPDAISAGVAVEPALEPRAVVLPLPTLGFAADPIDEILVRFQERFPGSPSGAAFVELELLRRSYSDDLPPPGSPALVRIGQEHRRAVGLSSAVPLDSRFEVTQESSLELSFGQPRLVVTPRDLKLHVRIRADGGPETEVVEVVARSSWHHDAIPLTSFVGREVEVSFELESADGRTYYCALGEPRIAPNPQDTPDKPDKPRPRAVLLVTSDTHRGDHIGATGGVRVETPNLDALAARGILFEDCYSATNITNASHAALMTGTHVRDTGVWDNQTRLSARAPTLAESFRKAGFVTIACVSVWHLEDEYSGLGQGFDVTVGPPPLFPLPDWIPGERTLEPLDRLLEETAQTPIFLWLHLYDAHFPYQPPGRFDRMYYSEERDPFDDSIELDLPPRALPPSLVGLTDLEYPRAQYRAEVSHVDALIGRVLDHPRLSTAIVAVTSDHGEELGYQGIYFSHSSLFPDAVHVPLILSWPGAPAGKRVQSTVRQIDVGRTLLDLARIHDREFPGRNLVEGLGRRGDAPVFCLSARGNSCSLRYGRWYMIFNLRDHRFDGRDYYPTQKRHVTRLYDLEADPLCTKDLSGVEKKKARALRERILEWLDAAHAENWSGKRTRDSDHVRALAAMGYADSVRGPDIEALVVDRACTCDECRRFR